jgi:hypothetical protein
MTSATVSTAESVWQQQSVWSQTADRLKRNLTRARTAALILTITGAVLATVGTQVAGVSSAASKGLLWAAAVAVGLVPLLRPRFSRRPVEAWARARSASESLKEQVYTYLARVSPYRDAGRDQQLRQRAGATLAAVDDLLPETDGIEPVPRPLPPVGNVNDYVTIRVGQQIGGYYRTRASRLRIILRRLRGAELMLAVTAVVLAAVAGTIGIKGAGQWVTVVTTISAALAAHMAAARYEYMLVEYSRTAAQLERLRDGREPLDDPDQTARTDDAFVAECERVISDQNEAWMAKLASDPD